MLMEIIKNYSTTQYVLLQPDITVFNLELRYDFGVIPVTFLKILLKFAVLL